MSDSQTVEADGEQLDKHLAVLEDVRALFSEIEEQAVSTLHVSNINSNFTCNRDISNPQPLSLIHPNTPEYTSNLETGESGKRTIW